MPLRLHFTFLIALLGLPFFHQWAFHNAYASWSTEETWRAALVTTLLFFTSILVHELSHAVMAVPRGLRVESITLWVLGGFTELSEEIDKPSAEFLVSVVGPFSNLILAAGFLGLVLAIEDTGGQVRVIARLLALQNVVLFALNMLPGLPLDGGRILRAATWQVTRSYKLGTLLPVLGGLALAMSAIGTGIYLGQAGSSLVLWLQMVIGGVLMGLVSLVYLFNLPDGDYFYRLPPELQRAFDLVQDDDFMWTDDGRPRRSWSTHEIQQRVDNLLEAADLLRSLRHYWTYQQRQENIAALEQSADRIIRSHPEVIRRTPSRTAPQER